MPHYRIIAVGTYEKHLGTIEAPNVEQAQELAFGLIGDGFIEPPADVSPLPYSVIEYELLN